MYIPWSRQSPLWAGHIKSWPQNMSSEAEAMPFLLKGWALRRKMKWSHHSASRADKIFTSDSIERKNRQWQWQGQWQRQWQGKWQTTTNVEGIIEKSNLDHVFLPVSILRTQDELLHFLKKYVKIRFLNANWSCNLWAGFLTLFVILSGI